MEDIQTILARWTCDRNDYFQAICQQLDENFAWRRSAYIAETVLKEHQLKQKLKKIKEETRSRKARVRETLRKQQETINESSEIKRSPSMEQLNSQIRHDIENISGQCAPVPNANVQHLYGMEHELCGKDREDSIKVPQCYKRNDIMGRYTLVTISENVANATEANKVNLDISTVTIDDDSDVDSSI